MKYRDTNISRERWTNPFASRCPACGQPAYKSRANGMYTHFSFAGDALCIKRARNLLVERGERALADEEARRRGMWRWASILQDEDQAERRKAAALVSPEAWKAEVERQEDERLDLKKRRRARLEEDIDDAHYSIDHPTFGAGEVVNILDHPEERSDGLVKARCYFKTVGYKVLLLQVEKAEE